MLELIGLIKFVIIINMHIHFVCSGNSYRSRLAEAYCKSKLKGQEIIISSSGTVADENKIKNGPISWYAMRLMMRNNLIQFMSWKQRQTTVEILKDVDLLICMTQSHLDFCQNELGYINKPSKVWGIPDLNEMNGFIPSTKPGIETDINHIKLTEQIYIVITQKVDDLVKRITNIV